MRRIGRSARSTGAIEQRRHRWLDITPQLSFDKDLAKKRGGQLGLLKASLRVFAQGLAFRGVPAYGKRRISRVGRAVQHR